MPTSRRHRGRIVRGFTLVELMVVVAIIGILGALAVFAVDPADDSDSVRNYADEIAARLDSARQRAISSGRWQRVYILSDQVVTYQSTTEGMQTPTAWTSAVNQLYPKHHEKIYQVSSAAHGTAGTSVSDGTGLPASIDFKPDGSASANTIFIGDKNARYKARVLVYSVTGSVHVYDQW